GANLPVEATFDRVVDEDQTGVEADGEDASLGRAGKVLDLPDDGTRRTGRQRDRIQKGEAVTAARRILRRQLADEERRGRPVHDERVDGDTRAVRQALVPRIVGGAVLLAENPRSRGAAIEDDAARVEPARRRGEAEGADSAQEGPGGCGE